MYFGTMYKRPPILLSVPLCHSKDARQQAQWLQKSLWHILSIFITYQCLCINVYQLDDIIIQSSRSNLVALPLLMVSFSIWLSKVSANDTLHMWRYICNVFSLWPRTCYNHRWNPGPGHVFCLLFRVTSACARPITGQGTCLCFTEHSLSLLRKHTEIGLRFTVCISWPLHHFTCRFWGHESSLNDLPINFHTFIFLFIRIWWIMVLLFKGCFLNMFSMFWWIPIAVDW